VVHDLFWPNEIDLDAKRDNSFGRAAALSKRGALLAPPFLMHLIGHARRTAFRRRVAMVTLTTQELKFLVEPPPDGCDHLGRSEIVALGGGLC
jgi:hypothetical protein